jgi:hypothetical protein
MEGQLETTRNETWRSPVRRVHVHGYSNGINQKCGPKHLWFNVKLPEMWSWHTKAAQIPVSRRFQLHIS